MDMPERPIKNRKYSISVIIISLLFFISFLITISSCLRLKLSPIPNLLKTDSLHSIIIIMNGKSPCLSCPDGKYIYSIRNRKDVLFVFTKKYSKNDIENFGDVFEIKGKMILADDKIQSFVNILFKCKMKKRFHKNNLVIKSNKIIVF